MLFVQVRGYLSNVNAPAGWSYWRRDPRLEGVGACFAVYR